MITGWKLDGDVLTSPSGTKVTIRDVLAERFAAINGQIDLASEAWRGWRIRQQFLIPPGQKIGHGLHVERLRFLAKHVRWERD